MGLNEKIAIQRRNLPFCAYYVFGHPAEGMIAVGIGVDRRRVISLFNHPSFIS